MNIERSHEPTLGEASVWMQLAPRLMNKKQKQTWRQQLQRANVFIRSLLMGLW